MAEFRVQFRQNGAKLPVFAQNGNLPAVETIRAVIARDLPAQQPWP